MTETTSTLTLDKIIALAKRRGFIYPTSDIYGGLASSYDYGPLGAELLRSIRNLWWEELITRRMDMIGIDTQILLHPETWVASGHVNAFNDPLVEDKVTHKRYRADHLISAWLEKHPQPEADRGGRARPGGYGRADREAEYHQPGGQPHSAAQGLQHHVPERDRRGGRRENAGLPARRDRPGHLHQLPQPAQFHPHAAAFRGGPDRQELPQRNHHRAVYLPHAGIRAGRDRIFLRPRSQRLAGRFSRTGRPR